MFADELVRIGAERADVVAITAAMLHPTGLAAFAERFPSGPSTSASPSSTRSPRPPGMAMGGLHPVVAVYSTFLNRAFDQLLMDVALHRLPVTVVLDRAGVTGTDGPRTTACGTCRSCRSYPACGRRTAGRGDPARGAARGGRCHRRADGGALPEGRAAGRIPAMERRGPIDVLRRRIRPDVLLVAVGSMVPMCLAVAERAADHGIEVTVVDPRWVLPVTDELVALAAGHRLVVTVEDGGRAGGVGTTLTRRCRTATATCRCGPSACRRSSEHGSRGQVLADAGLTEQDIARRIAESDREARPSASTAHVSDAGEEHGGEQQ